MRAISWWWKLGIYNPDSGSFTTQASCRLNVNTPLLYCCRSTSQKAPGGSDGGNTTVFLFLLAAATKKQEKKSGLLFSSWRDNTGFHRYCNPATYYALVITTKGLSLSQSFIVAGRGSTSLEPFPLCCLKRGRDREKPDSRFMNSHSPRQSPELDAWHCILAENHLFQQHKDEERKKDDPLD